MCLWCIQKLVKSATVLTKWAIRYQGNNGDTAHWTCQKSVENKEITNGKHWILNPKCGSNLYIPIKVYSLNNVKMEMKFMTSGADPGFFKRGGAQLNDWQNFGACGDKGCLRGMCPLRSGEKLQFSKSIRTIWSILFAWGAHTKSAALLSAKNRGGGRRVRSPLWIRPWTSLSFLLGNWSIYLIGKQQVI